MKLDKKEKEKEKGNKKCTLFDNQTQSESPNLNEGRRFILWKLSVKQVLLQIKKPVFPRATFRTQKQWQLSIPTRGACRTSIPKFIQVEFFHRVCELAA